MDRPMWTILRDKGEIFLMKRTGLFVDTAFALCYTLEEAEELEEKLNRWEEYADSMENDHPH